MAEYLLIYIDTGISDSHFLYLSTFLKQSDHDKRADYLDAWWNVVNWNAVAKRFHDAQGHK